jgi:MFS family permease
LGVVVSCGYLGISADPLFAGLTIDYLGWRWIFYNAVPIECTTLLITVSSLGKEKNSHLYKRICQNLWNKLSWSIA